MTQCLLLSLENVGMWNKYTILQSAIPIDYLHCQSENVPTIDKITSVCCALTNLCDSVVPFD